MKKTISFGCLAIIAIIIAWLGLAALILTWAWNVLVPTTFNGPHLDYGAAFAAVIILSLVGGFFRSTFTSNK